MRSRSGRDAGSTAVSFPRMVKTIACAAVVLLATAGGIRPQAIPPAIPRAESRLLVAGIPPQQTDSFDFTAQLAGQYLWFCGVPAHGTQGMWDRLIVSASAKVPSVTVK